MLASTFNAGLTEPGETIAIPLLSCSRFTPIGKASGLAYGQKSTFDENTSVISGLQSVQSLQISFHSVDLSLEVLSITDNFDLK